MNPMRLRRAGQRLLGKNGNYITSRFDDNNYRGIVVDANQRLPRWFQRDVTEPKQKTNIIFQLEVTGYGETSADLLREVFQEGEQLGYNGRDYVVERTMPVVVQDVTVAFFIIADPI